LKVIKDKKRAIYIFLFIPFLFTNCKNDNGDSKLYLGTYRSVDQVIPYPFVLQQKADSINLYDNKGVLLDKIKKVNIKQNDTLKFENKHFLIGKRGENYFNSFDLKDFKNFKLENGNVNLKSRGRFERITHKNKIISTDALETIGSNIWKYNVISDDNSNSNNDLRKEQLLHFGIDSAYVLTQYFYQDIIMSSEYEIKGYNYFMIDNRHFISFQKKEENPQLIFQIADFSHNNIELIDFSAKAVKTIELKKENNKITDFYKILENTSYYSNCFDGYQGEYYYEKDGIFKKGNQYLLNVVKSDEPILNELNSGYIIVHFNVNCKGTIGNYSLIQMNKRFETNTFSKELVGHIFNKINSIKDWTPTSSSIDWLPYKDVHTFLMFKIKNGKITEVLP